MRRLKILAFGFIFAFILLGLKLFYWQVIEGSNLSKEAKSQYEASEFLSAPRGNILATDNSWLAARGDAYLVYAQIPNLKDEPGKIADTLAPFFIDDPNDKKSLLEEIDRIKSILERKSIVWIPLKQKITPETKANIEALKISGIGFEKNETRLYSEASIGAQLLGFVGKDKDNKDQGYFGLEGYYDLTLSGKPGFIEREKDAHGQPIFAGEARSITAVSGVNLLTHIDKAIQLILEKKLLEGIDKYQASAGTAIVMNPKDGSIMAMSSYPSYDPRTYWKFSDELFRNPAVSSAFEPGSIFKVVVMAAALDAKVIDPETKCDICDGPVKIDKYSIETWNKKYFPDSTMTEVIVHSDNVGMTFVGKKLGADQLFNYLDKFGIGHPTGIDLQGESSPLLREKGTWNEVDLATASFGQGVAVTPIQMIRAVAAIANGGKIVTPQVTDKLMGEGWEEKVKPVIGSRIISEEVSKEITEMMVQAANYGESKWTAANGFSVAGKTGTAQIPVAGHYDAEKTIASFVGFSPASNPKFVMLVTLKEPKSSQWASETAAPLWYSIAKELFPYLGIQPES
jgi:cell division protein FtsI/penicillin-binding protein 2